MKSEWGRESYTEKAQEGREWEYVTESRDLGTERSRGEVTEEGVPNVWGGNEKVQSTPMQQRRSYPCDRPWRPIGV
jgi:hypothetical protein